MASIASSNKFDFVLYLRLTRCRICLIPLPTYFHLDNHSPGLPNLLRPSFKASYKRHRNINLLPIDFTLQLRLRGLTPTLINICVGTLGFRPIRISLILRYSCQHSHFRYLQQTSQSTFNGLRNAPLPCVHSTHPQLRSMA